MIDQGGFQGAFLVDSVRRERSSFLLYFTRFEIGSTDNWKMDVDGVC